MENPLLLSSLEIVPVISCHTNPQNEALGEPKGGFSTANSSNNNHRHVNPLHEASRQAKHGIGFVEMLPNVDVIPNVEICLHVSWYISNVDIL